MRSNSGRDEGRDNMHDPTIRDRSRGRDARERHAAPGEARKGDRMPARRARKCRSPVSGYDNSPRCGRVRGSGPACRRGQASRARSPLRAFPRRSRRHARGYRPGPGPALPMASWKRRLASIWLHVRSTPAGCTTPALLTAARIPGHCDAGRQLSPFPVGTEPLSGVKLAL